MHHDLPAELRTYLELLDRVPEVFRRAWDAIAIYDLEGRLVAGNAAARALVGDRLADDLGGAHFTAHLPLGAATAAARMFAQVATSGETVNTESAFRDADGSPIPVSIRLVAARFEGKIVGVIGFARDIRAQRGVEAQFMRSEQQFRSLFENHPDAITMLDLQSRFTRINAGTERLTGYSVDELVGRTPAFLSPSGAWADGERILTAIQRGEAAEFATTLRTKAGERRNVEGRAIPFMVDGRVRGFYLLSHDVTDEQRREREVELHTERIANLYRIASMPGLSAGERIDRALETGMRELDAEWAYAAELHEEQMTVTHTAGVPEFPAGHSVDLERAMMRRAVSTRDLFVAEDRGLVGVPIENDGEVSGVVGFVTTRHPLRLSTTDRDYIRAIVALIASATAQLAREKRLDTLAFHDTLTGLPNRALLHDRLEQTLLSARRHRRSFAVHYIDVDHFKTINDTHGHQVGDAVLIVVGNWLRSRLRDSDTIARVGGDEFVILQPEIDSEKQAEELAARLVAIRQHPFTIGTVEFHITVSVGAAVFPSNARNPVDLLRAADASLYQVKERGRNGYAVATVAS
jgi:diguanylate cyclase (GGDEF)-like protein/PAS domain S-box-containing protein